MTEGRYARSLRLLGESWRYLRARPRLFVLPAIAAVGATALFALVFLPMLWLGRDLPAKLDFGIAAAVASVPLTFVTVACNVGFLSMVLRYEAGEEPTVRDGWAAVRERRRLILGWALLSGVVGGILSFLEHLPGGEWIGRPLSFLGGLAWSLGTFFVVPVLVLEKVGPIEAVKRSAATFRRKWGEAVVADVGVGLVVGLAMLPGIALGCAGLVAYGDSVVSAAILLTLAVCWVIPLAVASSALTELFTLMVYREGETGELAGPWSREDLQRVVRDKKRSRF